MLVKRAVSPAGGAANEESMATKTMSVLLSMMAFSGLLVAG